MHHSSRRYKSLTFAALTIAACGQALGAQYVLTASGQLTNGVGANKDLWSPTFRSAIAGNSGSDFTGLYYSLSLTLESDAPFDHAGVTRYAKAIKGGQLTIGRGPHAAIDQFVFSSPSEGNMTFWPNLPHSPADHRFQAKPSEAARIVGTAYDESLHAWRQETFVLTETGLNLLYPAGHSHWGNDGKAFSPWFKDPSGAILNREVMVRGQGSFISLQFQGAPGGMSGANNFNVLPVDSYSLRAIPAVPEPSTYLLFAAGLLTLPLLRRPPQATKSPRVGGTK